MIRQYADNGKRIVPPHMYKGVYAPTANLSTDDLPDDLRPKYTPTAREERNEYAISWQQEYGAAGNTLTTDTPRIRHYWTSEEEDHLIVLKMYTKLKFRHIARELKVMFNTYFTESNINYKIRVLSGKPQPSVQTRSSWVQTTPDVKWIGWEKKWKQHPSVQAILTKYGLGEAREEDGDDGKVEQIEGKVEADGEYGDVEAEGSVHGELEV